MDLRKIEVTGGREKHSSETGFVFFVEAVEADGARFVLADRPDYGQAIRDAQSLAADFGGVPVHDMVA